MVGIRELRRQVVYVVDVNLQTIKEYVSENHIVLVGPLKILDIFLLKMLLKRKLVRTDIDRGLNLTFQYQYKRVRMGRSGCSVFCSCYPKCFLGCQSFRILQFGYVFIKKNLNIFTDTNLVGLFI